MLAAALVGFSVDSHKHLVLKAEAAMPPWPWGHLIYQEVLEKAFSSGPGWKQQGDVPWSVLRCSEEVLQESLGSSRSLALVWVAAPCSSGTSRGFEGKCPRCSPRHVWDP